MWTLTAQQLADLTNAQGMAQQAALASTATVMMFDIRQAMILMEMQLIFARQGKRQLALNGQASNALNIFIDDLQGAIEHLGHAYAEVLFNNDTVVARADLSVADSLLGKAVTDYQAYVANP